ncbi:hypothetical protein FAUST_10992 [Fusarium austroamericanum]|uniref:T6SS Phospholipase effector Tle1-like catalytic domain-containing protein n=1 Tax=Fusarium austroamericanum TaxID=282268 RepID=A0AAN5YZS0_FUSAU|nr:hypothetical protein FAUST_10992 [Fusarium austroamericanum]
MKKRSIDCCDGTNNDLRCDGTMWSNVGRIAECISEYTSKDKTTKQASEKGDYVVLIGFSRGAFIARCVIPFIVNVGILYKPPFREKTIEDIYTEWTQFMTPGRENTKRRELLFAKYNPSSDARRVIDALALWDTVSSLHHSPPKTYLDPVKVHPPWNVKYAFHALALEEHRGLFKPNVWTGDYPTGVKVLKQCWFRGVHSHVGGSNEQRSNNLTNVSLSWIFALWKLFAFFAGEKAALRTPGNGTKEFIHWSVEPSQLLQPVPPMKLKIPMGSLLPTEQATESDYEETSNRTTSIPYNLSISMPIEQGGYQKRQDYQNSYERGYNEGYKSGYQKGIDAVQGSTSYGDHNHEVANADTQDCPYRGSGDVSTLATDESSYNQVAETHNVYNTDNTETRSTIPQDNDRYWQEDKPERHRRSKKKSSRH